MARRLMLQASRTLIGGDCYCCLGHLLQHPLPAPFFVAPLSESCDPIQISVEVSPLPPTPQRLRPSSQRTRPETKQQSLLACCTSNNAIDDEGQSILPEPLLGLQILIEASSQHRVCCADPQGTDADVWAVATTSYQHSLFVLSAESEPQQGQRRVEIRFSQPADSGQSDCV